MKWPFYFLLVFPIQLNVYQFHFYLCYSSSHLRAGSFLSYQNSLLLCVAHFPVLLMLENPNYFHQEC